MELTQENVEKLNVAKLQDALFCKGLLLDAIEAGDKLEAENERLKAELKQTEVQDQVVIDTLRKENERLNKEIGLYEENTERQGKMLEAKSEENAKLKCLALHLFSGFAAKEWNEWHDVLYRLDITFNHRERAKRKCDRWRRIWRKTLVAYCKAKKELKEGK